MTEREQVLEVLRELMVELFDVAPEAVTEQARFHEDLNMDSLGLIELLMVVEDRFRIWVPEQELVGVTTIGEALTVVLSGLGIPA